MPPCAILPPQGLLPAVGDWKQGAMLPKPGSSSQHHPVGNDPQASHETQGETEIHPKTGPKLSILLVLQVSNTD